MRIKTLLLMAAVACAALSAVTASAHPCGQHETGAGSKKCESTEYDTTCGEDGKVPVEAGSVSVHANQTSDGAEAEACNDSGASITQGRLIFDVSDEGYARVVLDSDKDQKPQVEAGYIIVQAGPGAGQTGIWCSATGADGDGYSASPEDPGAEGGTTPDQWAECIPTR